MSSVLLMVPEVPGPCQCPQGSVLLKEKISKEEFDQLFERRKKEYEKHKNRSTSVLSQVLLAPANSPLQFPIQGVSVLPLKSRLIPGLAVYAEEKRDYKVSLKGSKGVFSVNSLITDVTVSGDTTDHLSVQSNSLSALNKALSSVSYKSTVYEIHTGDLVSFSFENYKAVFPIEIRQPQMPVMFDMGTDINSQVTITVKTFLRYNQLNILLSSIRKFYPTMTVVIADDSLEPEKIQGDHIQHYIMPPSQGWFAGRNLAISQVTTKYFLWVDDDFLFTEETQIEKMLEIMEAVPRLDVVGGSVGSNRFPFTLHFEAGDEDEGGCLDARLNTKQQTLPGFPQCSLVNGVVNFFLARTDSAQRARFDPILKRVAHPEFFMDGLGSLMVASCGGPRIAHQSPSETDRRYAHFRHPNYTEDMMLKYKLYYYKHNLKCIRRWR
uniref:Glycosyltransferase 2-like domain-containing protein n=2 Tax=Knipowitschia caucasica TaxID=637954 RepID=A0AAV2M4Y8_KNICA